MRDVVAGTTDFHAFSEITTRLLLGSRDKSTRYESINILTVLQKANKRYAGLEDWYAALSESAHPNYEGIVLGYSKDDPKNFLTTFETDGQPYMVNAIHPPLSRVLLYLRASTIMNGQLLLKRSSGGLRFTMTSLRPQSVHRKTANPLLNRRPSDVSPSSPG